MRRLLMTLPCLIALAACSDAPPPVGPPDQSVRASFPVGGVAGVIKVEALDPEPLRVAELVAPDGTTTPSSALDVVTNPRTIGGEGEIADPWRASMLGANGINPLPSGPVGPAVRSSEQLMLTVSTADIALPDPVAYGRDWQNYRIRLSFVGAANQLDVREIPAPQPPPEK
jgi:hypothetical protein